MNLATLAAFVLTASAAANPEIAKGSWRAWLDTPGGELPFGLEIVAPATDDKPAGITAFLVNGPEKIEVPIVKWEGDELVLSMDYYDAHLRAKVSADGKHLDGEFMKQRATGVARMPFHAEEMRAYVDRMFEGGRWKRQETPRGMTAANGRWRVAFADDADRAIAIIEDPQPLDAHKAFQKEVGVTGTFLTTTGDFRFLAGDFDGERVRLTCFDGAHAFLFTANIQPDGSLKGDFWSGNWGHDTWTAVRDDKAALPDAFTQVNPKAGGNINSLSFPDLDGKTRSLSEPALGGGSGGAKCRLYYVFGSWCPNCKDCSAYLNELLDKYKTKGLSVTGLSFEVTGERERDSKQAKIYAERAHLQFPVLLAGKSDRKLTAEALAPVLENFRAWPTVIFADRAGKVRAVYTGFSGPATGDENAKMRKQWEKIIEGLLAE